MMMRMDYTQLLGFGQKDEKGGDPKLHDASLKSLGINPNQSHRWSLMVSVPEDAHHVFYVDPPIPAIADQNTENQPSYRRYFGTFHLGEWFSMGRNSLFRGQ